MTTTQKTFVGMNSRNLPKKDGWTRRVGVLFLLAVVAAQMVFILVGMAHIVQSEGGIKTSTDAHGVSSVLKRNEELQPLVVNAQPPDAVFHGYPVYLKKSTEKKDYDRGLLYSTLHCVGEDYQSDAWTHRSCKFGFLCFDVSRNDFFLLSNPHEESSLLPLLRNRTFLDASSSTLDSKVNHTVSIGGINLKWTWRSHGNPRLEWFPRIMESPPNPFYYYELPDSVVMIPYHSLAGFNPGHLVWDDFLPIYNLLSMFQFLEEDNRQPAPDLLLIRYILDGRGMWASCDWLDEKRDICARMFAKFAPLMGVRHPMTTTQTTPHLNLTTKLTRHQQPTSNWVCAKHGVAGMGALTDHGPHKMHGWEEEDFKTSHNNGRGPLLYAFRNFMVSNLGLPTRAQLVRPPYRVVFSLGSSSIPNRALDFARQSNYLRRGFQNSKAVSVETHFLQNMTLYDQVQLATETSVFITICGGGAVTAMFLPRGASLFLYFVQDGGSKNGRPSGKPARLDWDLFNNLSYIRVHWMPTTTMDTLNDLNALALLIQHELDLVSRGF